MVKLLGSFLLLGAAGGARSLRLRLLRREIETLRALSDGLGAMGEEIRRSRTPLPRLLQKLGGEARSGAAAFFRSAALAVKGGRALPEAWRACAEELALSPREREIVRELARPLCGDEREACGALALARSRLSDAAGALERRQSDTERRITAVCFSAAALVIILLI